MVEDFFRERWAAGAHPLAALERANPRYERALLG
jgi:hypothetical protein